jgi:hypothetical protein
VGDELALIYSKNHKVEFFYELERLQRHTVCPCSECSKDIQGTGKTKERPLVYANKQRHLHTDQIIFRQKAWEIGKGKCAITNIQPPPGENELAKHIESHHLNSKESYPDLAETAENNSILLLKPIHTAYHSKFLKAFDCSYDPIALKNIYEKKGNIFTFILFLEQLKRDFCYDNKPVLTLKKFIQAELDLLWSTLEQPNETKPLILIENLNKLIKKLNNKQYIDLFLSQPEAGSFVSTYKKYLE